MNRNYPKYSSIISTHCRFFMPHSFNAFLFGAVLLTLISSCQNQIDSTSELRAVDSGAFFYDWAEQDSVLELTLTLDMERIKTQKEEEIYQNEIISIYKNSDTLIIPIQVSARGKTRKKICGFPPLRIKINDSIAEMNNWGPHRKYKIVTHCQPDQLHEKLLLKEYLVYELCQLLTPISFRAQLCRINYQFTDRTDTRFAVLLEDEDILAKRLQAIEVEMNTDNLRSINKEAYQQLVMFQYMIGNTDWNMHEQHNIVLLKMSDSPSPVPVPYDFDYCGLVNAPYATPYPTLPIKNVRERLFQYRGSKDDDFAPIIKQFKELKPKFYGLIQTLPYLDSQDKMDLTAYLEDFFMILDQPDWKDTIFRQ